MMTTGVLTVAYLVAGVLFIRSLGGLSKQETARRGNTSGIIGMAAIDSTHVKAHRSAGGGKGGPTRKRSGVREAGARRNSMP